MKGTGKGCLLAAAVVLALGTLAVVLLAPRLIREGQKFYQPISRMSRAGSDLKELQEKSRWQEPSTETLAAEQVDRFLEVRKRLDRLYREAGPRMVKLPRERAKNISEVGEVVGAFGDIMSAQLDAFVQVGMTPREYHFIERIVYGKWRPALGTGGAHPAVLAAAARELEESAQSEPDARVAARLRKLASAMRSRTPPAPPGIDPQVHVILLARLQDIERYSLDAHRELPIPVPP